MRHSARRAKSQQACRLRMASRRHSR